MSEAHEKLLECLAVCFSDPPELKQVSESKREASGSRTTRP